MTGQPPYPEFLARLKSVASAAAHQGRSAQAEDIRFMIRVSPEGAASVRVVDASGKETDPDYRLYDGPVFQVLRTIFQIRNADRFAIAWDGRRQEIPLFKHPHLLYQLLECDNLTDGKLQPVRIRKEPVLELHLDLSGREESGIIHPRFRLLGDGEQVENPAFISDSFALAEGQILPIKPIGENFLSASVFLDPFPEILLERYLSVLFTNYYNIIPDLPGRRVVQSEEPVHARPVLIIEKVDSDQTLYLRVSQEIPGIDARFLEDFRLTSYASASAQDEIILRPIAQESLSGLGDELATLLERYSPSRAAAKEVFRDGNTFIVPKPTAEYFLFGGLPTAARRFRLLGADLLKGYRIRPVQPKLSVRLGSGIDFLEGDASLDVAGETFTLARFLQMYREQKYIALSDGDKAIIDEQYVRKLERLFEKGKKKQQVRISVFDLPEIIQLLETVPEGPAVNRIRSLYEGFNGIADRRIRISGLRAELRPYQREGVKWLDYLYENKMGGCLADDMGLGKTVQTIALLCRTAGKTDKPSLIVMPKSLLFNWAAELNRFAPQLRVATYYGNGRQLDDAMGAQIILTTYGMVRRDISALKDRKFHLLILDESQNIKNTAAQMTQAVLLLQAEGRLALSGTPVENNLSELYSLFRFLNPSMFGSAQSFAERYITPIQRDADKEVLQELRRKIYPFILRRTKQEVLTELPDRIDQRIHIALDEQHAAFYEQRRRYFHETVREGISSDGLNKSQFLILQALSELRRIASVPESMSDGRVASSKIPALLDSLEEAVANGHKAVVFFNFIAGIELVGERLEQAGIGYAVMTGATQDRQRVVERFQTDPACQVLLMTLKTGGVGLNLTAADTVFIFEPWWNRAEEEQAVSRLHRIGQKASVMSFSIIADGTIEEKIALLQEQKQTLVDALISSDGHLSKHLTEEDIDFILR